MVVTAARDKVVQVKVTIKIPNGGLNWRSGLKGNLLTTELSPRKRLGIRLLNWLKAMVMNSQMLTGISLRDCSTWLTKIRMERSTILK
jgi:hypothetical protein